MGSKIAYKLNIYVLKLLLHSQHNNEFEEFKFNFVVMLRITISHTIYNFWLLECGICSKWNISILNSQSKKGSKKNILQNGTTMAYLEK